MAMPIPPANSCPDTDVLVVGHGPVALVLAVLLAQHGWLTTLADPRQRSGDFQRVVGLDPETVRVLTGAGIGDALPEIGAPGTDLDFEGCVLRFQRARSVTMFHQHALETALLERALRLPNLQVMRGRPTSLIADRGDHAESVSGGETITSSWVVGCEDTHRFHSSSAEWRSGRILLAGGSALGIRDTAKLVWKLDLVLRERAHETVLDSHVLERGGLSRLTGGVLRLRADESTAGTLLPSAQVRSKDLLGSFDDVLGTGFALLTIGFDAKLGRGQQAFLADIDTTIVRLLPAGSPPTQGCVVDVENVYLPLFAETGEIGVLVRPDHYVFGTARVPGELTELVDDLRTQLFQHRMRPRPIE